MLGKLLSFSGKSSLYKTGSARCSTTFRGMVPNTEANLFMHSDLREKERKEYETMCITIQYRCALTRSCMVMAALRFSFPLSSFLLLYSCLQFFPFFRLRVSQNSELLKGERRDHWKMDGSSHPKDFLFFLRAYLSTQVPFLS